MHACVNKEHKTCQVRDEAKGERERGESESDGRLQLRERQRRNLPHTPGVSFQVCPVQETPSVPLQLGIYPTRSLHHASGETLWKIVSDNRAERGGRLRRMRVGSMLVNMPGSRGTAHRLRVHETNGYRQ